MSKKFSEYKEFDLSKINKDILKFWEQNDTFHQSMATRADGPTFVFYEGPPSANGLPGIHHVVSRAIKDIFCRYKTQQGFLVKRKAGWDTHGLPVELAVEKMLGITKENIGKTISVADYNAACRKEVMKYTDKWEDLTHKMGYWVNMDDPYVTYDSRYIETLWYLLKELYKKNLLYKGYSIQPYSPAAGTGLSSHELNQPGCYRDVKDTTCIAQFKVIDNEKSKALFKDVNSDLFILAWTTTPWTLPSNTALAVGANIRYVKVKSFNPYTSEPVTVILAKDLVRNYFPEKNSELAFDDYKGDGKNIPYQILEEFKGHELVGVVYEQLIPWVKPLGDAFRVIAGDFVTTEDGTGIVHIAPTFGADDDRVAKHTGIAPLMLVDKEGKQQPMVDRQGRFFPIEDLSNDFVSNNIDVQLYSEFAGRFVKNEYDATLTENDSTLDIDLSVMLKRENRAFKVEKHIHSYPHCWRTDKPVLYYPLDSWFIKTTAVRDQMIGLNKTINWKPQSTGTGRFGNWLENLVDWNLSRSRYWGTPLPIWRTEDGSDEICIGSAEELIHEIKKSVDAGVMEANPFKDFTVGDYSKLNYERIDFHRPYVDEIVLVSTKGEKMFRETDLIDVWFDSGAMPFAQAHYPFECQPPEAPSNSPQGGGHAPRYQTTRTSTYPLLKELAEKQKENPTAAESFLWNTLKGKKLGDYKFRRQHIIDQYIADFVCLEKQLIIEISGGYHSLEEVEISDIQRTEILESLGFTVIRFSKEQVVNEIELVQNKILHVLDSLPPGGRFGDEAYSFSFPADFIAEGVDQTRGWFFTLHAIATMVKGSVAFKNIISNGLVLDANGNKMSKRLGNGIDPFETIEKYGSDPLRWYMITNSQPWDNLKFDITGVEEVRRKFFGTLYNTYNFFALYANVDGFTFCEEQISDELRPELDRWILSLLNTLIKNATDDYENYEPTRAGRVISEFVTENLSNWYVRLSRKRFWGGEYDTDKISAYQTLYTCLETVAKLAAPIAPFYTDQLYCDLNRISGRENDNSIHLTTFPKYNEKVINKELEEQMDIAQKVSSMILGLRRREKLKVRQPLAKIIVPVLNEKFRRQFEAVESIILTEVNVKEVEYLTDSEGVIKKKIKANFKALGPKYGKLMKAVSILIGGMSQGEISSFERTGAFEALIERTPVILSLEDVEILSEDIPGLQVACEGAITVALDINVTPELRLEGIAREFVNRIQNLRKDSDFEVTDKIILRIVRHPELNEAMDKYGNFIGNQTLASRVELVDGLPDGTGKLVEIEKGIETYIQVEKEVI
jgi:isoleucyl-tRNA synthetase